MTQQSKSWFGRNWKWFVPVLCLTVMIGFVGLFGALMVGIEAVLKSSKPYQAAVGKAKADPRVIAALGTPIKEGMFVTGNVSLNSSTSGGSTGRANFVITIYGPKGKAKIHAEAAKSAGVWSFSKLIVHVLSSDEEIDLNEPGKKSERTEVHRWTPSADREVCAMGMMSTRRGGWGRRRG